MSELWRCPACGQEFVSPNMPHSCRVQPLDRFFAGAAPGLREVLDTYVAAMSEHGPVTVNVTKSRVACQVRMRFAGIDRPRRDHLLANLLLTRPVQSERLARAEHVPRPVRRLTLARAFSSGGVSSVRRMLVRELRDGEEIDQVLLVRDRRPSGKQVALTLADRTGAVTAIVPASEFEPGQVVRVAGRHSAGRVHVREIRPAREGEYALEALVDGPPRSPDGMEADLRELIATVQNPHLRALLDAVLGPSAPTWPRFRDAPAAKRYHQAYRHGLLEHSLGVAQAVSAISATFGGIDRDVAVTGALLHDIGKLEAYTADPLAIDLTDLGKLQGEIALGYYRIRRAIEDLPGFPEQLAAAVLHIILSHHGTLAHGSPVVPCTREATLVHMVDNLGGRLGSFDRLEKELPDGSRWSPFDRALAGSAWFAGRQAA